MKRFVTSDYHLGEDRMAIMQRPFKNQKEMIDLIVERHNEVVGPDDIVYNLGDVCYQKYPEFLSEMSRLNGTHILLRGNHDRVFTDEQLLVYFKEVIPEGDVLELEIGGINCALTHYPSRAVLERFNLVGHIHGAWKYQLNMLNCGIDVNHFVPHDMDVAVPFFFKAITEAYDQDVWAAYSEVNMPYVGSRGKKGSYFSGEKNV
jgi:calcineurin-like phosphoesterase family protein